MDNEIIKWIKDRMTHEVYGMDYVEEYPYEVMLSYPIGENKVRIFCIISLSLENHGLNNGFFLSLFKLIPLPHTLNCLRVSLFQFHI